MSQNDDVNTPASNRLALVTGGGRGIGRAIAVRLAVDGLRVAIVYRSDAASAEATVEQIRGSGGEAMAFCADLGDPDAVDGLLDEIGSVLGEVSVLVANAGMASRGRSLVDTEVRELEQLFQVSVTSALQLCARIVPTMRKAARGDIVFISSSAPKLLAPGTGPYAISKQAMESLALILAKEEAHHGVRVNIVAPGLVATEMGDRLVRAVTRGAAAATDEVGDLFPFGRPVRPEDVAAAVAFLVSEQGASITGQRVAVDGGAPDVPALLARTARSR